MHNRRIFEYFIIALIIGMGAPIMAVFGAMNGEKLAAYAYPKPVETAAPIVKDFKSIVLSSPENIEAGKSLFQTNCTACHGPAADGNGPAAASLTPHPRNFLDPKARWTRGRQPVDIYKTISEGSPGTAMVGFAVSLKPADRWALVHFLGSLPGLKGQFKPVDEAFAATWKPEP